MVRSNYLTDTVKRVTLNSLHPLFANNLIIVKIKIVQKYERIHKLLGKSTFSEWNSFQFIKNVNRWKKSGKPFLKVHVFNILWKTLSLNLTPPILTVSIHYQ